MKTESENMMSKLPLRERRYKALLNQIARLTLARNKAIRTLVKAENALPGLERKARRLEFPTARAKAEVPAVSDVTDISVSDFLGHGDALADIPDMPTFLDRRTPGELKDEAAKQEIMEQQSNRKRSKANWRITKMKAKKSGDLRKMPLEGKAALEFINNG